MKKVALLTDSTSDIPKELREEYDIHMIPLSVVHKDKAYLDGIDITSDEFYELLVNTDELPKSSQPSPGDFVNIYRELLNEYEQVISVHLSAGLSGTLNAANQAKEHFADKVHIVDSKSIGIGIGIQVLEAAKALKAGKSAEEVVAMLENNKTKVEALFTLDTMEYLYKGGRIGKVSSIMGSLLNIKPVIRVEDGIYVPFAKVRSRKAALEKIVSFISDLGNKHKIVSYAVTHGADLPACIKLAQTLEDVIGMKPTIVTQVGPVIGVHTGPGTLAAAVLYE